MNRTVAYVAGVLTLAVAVYAGSRLSAQTTTARPAGAGTRVAILNLRFVIKKYKKYLAFMEDIKKRDKKYVDDLNAKNNKLDELNKQLTNTTDADKREQLEKAVRNLKRAISDLKESARKEMGRLGAEEMVRVYKEIRAATTRHAKANNIDLVLHFNGPGDKQEVDNPTLIQQNFNAGTCPLYWNDSVDISADILKALNDAYNRSVRVPSSR